MKKATNEQKQKLKMYNLKFKPDITFEKAKVKIDKKENESKDIWIADDGMHWFERWLEDELATGKKLKEKTDGETQRS